MPRHRTSEERAALLTRYAERVGSLTPEAWGRLRIRCAELDGPEFSALIRRTQLAAKAREYPIRPAAASPIGLRMIRGASRVLRTSFAFTGQVMAEFEAAQTTPPEPPRPRTRSLGSPTTDAFVDARIAIETALTPIERGAPGLATAVRAGADAVYMQDFLTEADFTAVYAFMESEIPFAEIERPIG